MGFFKRLRGGGHDDDPPELADVMAAAARGELPTTATASSLQATPATPDAVLPAAGAGGATDPAMPDLSHLGGMGGLSALRAMGSGGVFDLRGVAGARQEILDALAHGQEDPAALREAIVGSLKRAGIPVNDGTFGDFDVAPDALAAAGFAAPAAHEDPATRLRNLDELKAKALVDDAEYAKLRQQILDDL